MRYEISNGGSHGDLIRRTAGNADRVVIVKSKKVLGISLALSMTLQNPKHEIPFSFIRLAQAYEFGGSI